ncbi:MAG: hypothetical protein NVSMB52_09520 [Chloroflexota bacterium]
MWDGLDNVKAHSGSSRSWQPLEFIGIGASHRRKMERERMPEIVGAKRRDVPDTIIEFSIMPAPNLLEDEVDGAHRETTVLSSCRNTGRRQEERRYLPALVSTAFPLEILRQSPSRISGQEHCSF